MKSLRAVYPIVQNKLYDDVPCAMLLQNDAFILKEIAAEVTHHSKYAIILTMVQLVGRPPSQLGLVQKCVALYEVSQKRRSLLLETT
jgi:hypothetical protein